MRHWHYEEQDAFFYTPGVKQERCNVCGKSLLDRQLKYCSKVCYGIGQYNRKKPIASERIICVMRKN